MARLKKQFRMTERVLRAEIKSLRQIMDERHRLYKERAATQKIAVDDALVAVKEQTAQSFLSSEKAIVKAEEAQSAYNVAHNDLSRKMDEQYKNMVPASEARLKWDGLDKAVDEQRREIGAIREAHPKELTALRIELMKEISTIRESDQETGGKLKGKEESQKQQAVNSRWIIGIVVMVALSFVTSSVAFIISMIAKHP